MDAYLSSMQENMIRSNMISIVGEEVELVEEFKYFRVHLESRLDRSCNSKAVYKRRQGRLFF